MVTEESAHFASEVVGVVHFALKVATDEEWPLVVLAKDIDFSVVEGLALVALDDLEALVLYGSPQSDRLVCAACQYVFPVVNDGELTRVDFSLMALQTV